MTFQVIVDGPYGSPTQYHEDFNTVLLVGAGIGVTPFASVLRHLLYCFQEEAPGAVQHGASVSAVKVSFWSLQGQGRKTCSPCSVSSMLSLSCAACWVQLLRAGWAAAGQCGTPWVLHPACAHDHACSRYNL